MAYGSGNSNIKMTPLSLTDANAWRDVLGWEINDGGASVDVGMAYSAVGWVNRCVHLRAGALKELPWSLMKGDSEIANSESEDYSFLPWLESLPDLLYLAESALCITGTAYIGKVRNRGKRIEDLRWFAPSTMEPIWSPVDGLIGYKRTIGSTGGSVSVQPWSVENIIYFHILNPLHETEPGASPVAAALLDAQVIYNLNQYSSLFFQRGAIKPTLLTVEGMPPPAERERLKAWWQRAFSGVKNAFNTEIISASVKPIVVGEGLEALNNNSLTEEKREAISTALGVPHSMVMSNASNFATAEADRLNLYDTTIIPRAKTIANSLNRQLFTELGYRIVFKPESLSIYQEDEEQRAGALVQLVNAGMKLSVAAEILGIGLPDGVTYESLDEAKQQADAAQQALLDAQLAKQQQNNTSSDNAQDANQPKANASDNTQAKTKEAAQFRKWLKKRENADIHMFKAEYLSHDELHEIADDVREVATEQPFFTLPETFTRDSVKALLLMNPDDDEAEQKIRMELERRSARNIDKAFTEMVNTLYPAGYDGFGGAFIDPNIEASRIQRAFREEQALRDAVSRALIDSADLGVSIGIAQLESVGIGFDYLLAHTSARDWAIAYTDILLEQMAVTSGRLVGSTVARWFDNGEPLEQLIQDLEPVFGRKRAERIAATEVTRAAAQGTVAAGIESGVIDHQPSIRPPENTHVNCRCWLSIAIDDKNKGHWVFRTSKDERVCPICSPFEGRWV